jgi:hypothetical protein
MPGKRDFASISSTTDDDSNTKSCAIVCSTTRDVVVPRAVQRDVAVAQIAKSFGVTATACDGFVRVCGASSTAVDDACRALVDALGSALVNRSTTLAKELAAQRACVCDGSTDVKQCVICLSAPSRICCVPCGHLALCESDAVALLSSTNRQCPVCRTAISGVLRVFT